VRVRAAAVAVIVALATVAALGSASPAGAANECRGLLVCVPIAGPWVAIPTPRTAAGSNASYLLRCPRGFIVAGTDALVADRATDVAIRGEPGSPVAPGVTVGREVLFTGVYGGNTRAPTSFRPFLGCVPAQGGGGRSQTIHIPRQLSAVHPVRPIVREVVDQRLRRGGTAVAAAQCRPGGRLLGTSHAVGFFSRQEPSRALLQSVSVDRTVRGTRVVARARLAPSAPPGLRVELQLHAICTRGAG
jgi:hypothetical protein